MKARPTGAPTKVLDLNGMLFAWVDGDGPVLVSWPDQEDPDHRYLPLFTTIEKLRAMSAAAGIVYDQVKQIADAQTFVADFSSGLRARTTLIVDPHTVPGAGARVRYYEVKWPSLD